MTPAQSVDARPSPIAGQWYPADPATLSQTIDDMLADAEVPILPGRLIGLLAPHAGLRYSGPVAAHAFKLVSELDITRVTIISPMHHAVDAPILTTTHDAYRTPLGDIPVDHKTVEALAERLPVKALSHDPEHALEIELPFLQRVAGDFSLIPLMLRDQSLKLARKLGTALAEILASGESDLIVASSDLSHFYTHEVAQGLDAVMLERIAALDPEGIMEVEQKGLGFACGRGAIATMLVAARALGADAAQIIRHTTSGEASGDFNRVVGYGAAAVYQAA